MTNAHAQQYYFGSGTETNEGSGAIGSYDNPEIGPAALNTGMMVEATAPQPGLDAPIAQDKQRGAS